jgi:hypothetical protein
VDQLHVAQLHVAQLHVAQLHVAHLHVVRLRVVRLRVAPSIVVQMISRNLMPCRAARGLPNRSIG